MIRALYPVTFFAGVPRRSNWVESTRTRPGPWSSPPKVGRLRSSGWRTPHGQRSSSGRDFPGVFGYQAIKDVKPGAKVYASFSDPQAVVASESPVYMAGQFYGGGVSSTWAVVKCGGCADWMNGISRRSTPS